jgi:hypothetical protein
MRLYLQLQKVPEHAFTLVFHHDRTHYTYISLTYHFWLRLNGQKLIKWFFWGPKYHCLCQTFHTAQYNETVFAATESARACFYPSFSSWSYTLYLYKSNIPFSVAPQRSKINKMIFLGPQISLPVPNFSYSTVQLDCIYSYRKCQRMILP